MFQHDIWAWCPGEKLTQYSRESCRGMPESDGYGALVLLILGSLRQDSLEIDRSVQFRSLVRWHPGVCRLRVPCALLVAATAHGSA
jgi:hypothetical protein